METLRKTLDWSFPRGSDFSRTLLIASMLIVILLPAYNVAFVYPSLTKMFTDTMTNDATRIAKYFRSMFETRISELPQNSLDPQILQESNRLRDNFGLAKLKIFSSSGEILFSTDSKEIGKQNREAYFREVVSHGGVYSKVVKRNSDSLEHERMVVDAVETYVPMIKDGVFRGAFEIYYDITEKKQNLEKMLFTSFVIVVALALCVFLISSTNFVKEKRRLAERKRAENEREKLIGELQEALTKVETLSGLIPICASCKKIRDDQGYWNRIEDYLSGHSKATFSHGICPECARRLYPQDCQGG